MISRSVSNLRFSLNFSLVYSVDVLVKLTLISEVFQSDWKEILQRVVFDRLSVGRKAPFPCVWT